MTSLMSQKMLSPSEMLAPSLVLQSSWEDVIQSNPINITTRAIKNVCIYIICLLIKLIFSRSSAHLKYLGKIICTRLSITKRLPMSLRWISIFFEHEAGDKWSEFSLFQQFKI